LTSDLEGALPERYVAPDPPGERHGSWEWVWQNAEPRRPDGDWVVFSVTPLDENASSVDEVPRRVSMTAWRLTGDASTVIETFAKSSWEDGARGPTLAESVTRLLRPLWLPPLRVGESLVGEGNEVAHVDVLIGSKSGPVGKAFANALVNQKEGHTNLLAVVAPNLPAKPDTIISNKVTIKGATQAMQMFGPAQAAVARGVVDSVREGVIGEGDVDDLCLICGVFIHWEATDDKKIFDYNYQATKEAIARALGNEPSVSSLLDAEATARHPFAARAEG
jgi:5,6,7,8-tetrahydromethanopterin hydro-lyase